MMMWGWILIVAVAIAVCMPMMARMMRQGGSWHLGPADNRDEDAPERILASRLASGEIDVAEFERLRDALRRPSNSTADGGGAQVALNGARQLPDDAALARAAGLAAATTRTVSRGWPVVSGDIVTSSAIAWGVANARLHSTRRPSRMDPRRPIGVLAR